MRDPTTRRRRRCIKPALVSPLLCLLPLPFARSCWRAFEMGGTDSARIRSRRSRTRSGNGACAFSSITLADHAAARLVHAPWLIQLRRMLGLFAFFYVLMHFLTWLILDQGLYWPGILGHRQTAVHHDRFRRAAAADPAGGDVDERDDASPGQALENAASPDLPDRAARRVALLVAGQSGHPRTADLSRRSRAMLLGWRVWKAVAGREPQGPQGRETEVARNSQPSRAATR